MDIKENREITLRFRVNKDENERIEKLANDIGMNKSRLIRTLVLGDDLSSTEFSNKIGMFALVKYIKRIYDKTKDINLDERILFETDEDYLKYKEFLKNKKE